MAHNDNLLTPAQAAEKLGVAIQTLNTWRCTKRYPLPYVKAGRKVMYRANDVTAFIESRLVECAGA